MATANILLFGFLILILIIAAYHDLRYHKIPNLLTYPTMLLAILYHTLLNGLIGFQFSAGGLALGIGLFIFPYVIGKMGAGDAKLMGAVGAVLGPKAVFICTVSTALFGGLYALMLLVIHRNYCRELFKRLKTATITFVLTKKIELAPGKTELKKPKLYYGLSIALGTCFYMFLQMSGYGAQITLMSS